LKYTYGQLKQLWIQNGGNKLAADIAAAVALAESGGDPNASNSNTDGSTDRGLWQINSVHGSQSTFDVTANTKAAIAISGNGSNWQPWVTFQTGAYRKFLAPGTAAAPVPSGGSSPAGTELAGFNWISSPLDTIGLGWVGNIITGTTGSFATIGDVAKSISGLTRSLSKFLELFALLFRPEFWLRVGAFFFGLITLGAGLYFLKESLQSLWLTLTRSARV
jgi:Lysozyme like domain